MLHTGRQWRRGARVIAAIGLGGGLAALSGLGFDRALRLDLVSTGLALGALAAVALERVVDRAHRAMMAHARLANAGAIAAAVSHEVGSPLSAIVIAVDTLLDDPGSPDAREMLEDVALAAQRIAVIARDLSTLASPIEEPLGAVDLNAVIDGATRLAAYQLRGQTRLERGPCDVPPVVGSSSRLVQVVMNLLVNAAGAARPDADCVVRVAAERDDDEVVLRVSDTGSGMDEHTRAHLFEPYFTTRRDRGGTGLGLAICKRIVDAAGGRIDVDTTPGSGTTMSIHLRVAA